VTKAQIPVRVWAFFSIMIHMNKVRRFQQDEIDAMAEVLEKDGVLSVPTDTVYGLCAKMDSLNAQEHLRDIKHRPLTKAFPVMCGDEAGIEEIALLDERSRKLVRGLMPGPVTLILRKQENVADYVNGGMETLAVRMATSDALRNLMKKTGPLFMTSANLSGEQPCKTLEEIEAECEGIDGMMEGSTEFGKASTIIDCTKDEIVIVRPGPIDMDRIEEILKGE